ncbi:hypothetical protein Chor_010120 [Crotalus horridus]
MTKFINYHDWLQFAILEPTKPHVDFVYFVKPVYLRYMDLKCKNSVEGAKGKNGISADAALRFIKIIFSYEEWDSFDHAIVLFFSFLQNQSNPVWKKAEAEIKLLLVMQNLLTIRKARHGLCVQGDNIRETAAFRSPGKKYIAFLD